MLKAQTQSFLWKDGIAKEIDFIKKARTFEKDHSFEECNDKLKASLSNYYHGCNNIYQLLGKCGFNSNINRNMFWSLLTTNLKWKNKLAVIAG